jgi:hypothetical protein
MEKEFNIDKNKKKKRRRSKTIYMNRFPKNKLEFLKKLYSSSVHIEKPKKYGDCTHSRPCLFVSCRYNLYLDVTKSGSIVINHPYIEPNEMKKSCVLDVVMYGRCTLQQTGELLNLSRERIRQIEEQALKKIAERSNSIVVKDSGDLAIKKLKEFNTELKDL